jgi:hypothetical protein
MPQPLGRSPPVLTGCALKLVWTPRLKISAPAGILTPIIESVGSHCIDWATPAVYVTYISILVAQGVFWKALYNLFYWTLLIWKARSKFIHRHPSDCLSKQNLVGTAERWRLSWLLMLGEMSGKVGRKFQKRFIPKFHLLAARWTVSVIRLEIYPRPPCWNFQRKGFLLFYIFMVISLRGAPDGQLNPTNANSRNFRLPPSWGSKNKPKKAVAWLLLVSSMVYSSILKMEAARFSEMSVKLLPDYMAQHPSR